MDTQIYNILEKYYRNECSADEVRLLLAHFNTSSEQELLDLIMKGFELEKREFNYEGTDRKTLDAVYLKLEEQIRGAENNVQPKTKRLWPRIGIAAAVAAIAFGIWFYTSRQPNTSRHPELVSGSQDIAPGGNRAILTSNGKSINLSNTKTGLAINAAQLTYSDGTKIDASALGMTEGDSRALEVITPKGGTYFFILQDGTKVWLNADSKLEFLSDYRNKLQRIVKISGEAYFEVATSYTSLRGGTTKQPSGKKVPFLVESDGQLVEVLGTHFNVSAYKGEAIKTTLLEGSVRVAYSSLPSGVSPRGGERILRPGEQSTILSPFGRDGEAREGITVKQVDPELAIAWKNGLFTYSNTEMDEVMRQVARWYDVTIEYQNPALKNKKLSGSVTRYDNLSVLLKALEYTAGVKFKIEGKTVTVGNKI